MNNEIIVSQKLAPLATQVRCGFTPLSWQHYLIDKMPEPLSKACPVNSLARVIFHNYQAHQHDRPYLVGLTGSVAVGKSFLAEHLQLTLSQVLACQVITTDCFLKSNAQLREEGLLHKKGFPCSYDQKRFSHTLQQLKLGQEVVVWPYCHEHYDLKPKTQTITTTPIIILEGLNILNPQSPALELVNQTIYLDAALSSLEHWYIERFQKFCQLAKDKPLLYYHRFKDFSIKQIKHKAQLTWQQINRVNLEENILPYQDYANIIMHKNAEHSFDYVTVTL